MRTRDVICVLVQRLALRGLRAGLGRAGPRDHRGARGHADAHGADALAARLRDLAAQARVLARLRGAGRARSRRRAGRRPARRRGRGRRALRLDGRLGRRLAPVAAVAADRVAVLPRLQPVSVQVAGYVQGPTTPPTWATRTRSSTTSSSSAAALDGRAAVVVFVDDLDRCSDESIMETLQAINLVLGAERLLRRAGHRPGHDPPRDRPPARDRATTTRRPRPSRRTTCARSSSSRCTCPGGRPISASASSRSSSARARSASSPPAARAGTAMPRRPRPATRTRPMFSLRPRRHRAAARADPARGAGHQGGARGAAGVAQFLRRQPARAQAAGQRAPAREDPAAAARRPADRRAAAQARGLAGLLRRARPSDVDDALAARGEGPGDDRRSSTSASDAFAAQDLAAERHARARRPDLAAHPRPAGGYSPADRSGVRSSGSASSISFVKMRSLRL